MTESGIVTFRATLIYESAKAFLIAYKGYEIWFPKSQCKCNRDGTFSIGEWIAKKKGITQ